MSPNAAVERMRDDVRALPKRDTPHLRSLRREWSKRLKTEAAPDLIALAQALERDADQTRKWLAYELIRFHPSAWSAIGEADIADFVGRAQSWYAVDALGTILIGPLWAKGRLPDSLIGGWARSDDRWLRRSALVATVKLSPRPEHTAATLAICRKLAADRDDMVEKALSWALRELSKRDRAAVEAFMAEMDRALPARAIREVRNKLTSGLKTPKRVHVGN
jgi:3-methyladenine DNA glycosylase AlkD